MIHDSLTWSGRVEIRLITPYEIIELYGMNFITAYGKSVFMDQLADTPVLNGISYIGVGSGTGQDVNDTTLATEIDRIAITSKTSSANQLIIESSFGVTEGIGTISEIGLFNASTGSNMISYIDSSSLTSLPTTKTLGDILDVTWTIDIN